MIRRTPHDIIKKVNHGVLLSFISKIWVTSKDEPFVCMVQFLTSAESADMVLVGTAEFVAIYVVVLFKRMGRYRERLQTHLLKNPPTP